MDTTHVQPGKGIGSLMLGMHRTEIEAELQKLHRTLGGQKEMRIGGDEPLWDDSDAGKGCYHVRYFAGDAIRDVGDISIFFMIGYDENGKAVSISIDRDARPELCGFDVSQTEAEPLVEALKQYDTCVFDDPDEQLSTQYTFPTIGVRLWREMAFHRKLLEDTAWVESMSQVLEDEYEHLYFELVTVFLPEYAKIFGYV
ncbi:MAG: hypothetical protein IKC03_03610 [Oscillospiraceae bacterium]|nr:hypothetical protein [Oscillospiraceae bacterium]